MKILHYEWASFYEQDIREIYRKNGISFDVLKWNFQDKNVDEKFLSHVAANIDLKQYDFVFSVNYWPLLSVICKEKGIPYLSWCYDNPLNVRDIHLTLGNAVNRVYCFDKMQVQMYRQQGFDTVYHLPLGVNAARLSRTLSDSSKLAPYAADVSFVGKLYESALGLILTGADEYSKGYIQSILNIQGSIYGAYIIDKVITDELVERLRAGFAKANPQAGFILQPEELNYALACEVTRRERIILLTLCGKRAKTKFYSYDQSDIIKGVEKMPPVQYWEEMPYVFAASKINLNVSLRAIQTGIPLRALDIMACGGFLLSNYQEELAEYFVPEEELVLYESMEDAIAKIQFYLSHEELRKQIAKKGREKTFRDFNMEDRLKEIFKDFI